jgi:hypothetical protein
LDEEIEDDRSSRKKDRGQLNKQKKPPLDAWSTAQEGRKGRLAKP